jgi:ABC-type multidrug transport system fused ATPase/permease subunit
VFKLEPTLMTNESYVSAYPALAAFLDRHPEVARNAAFFLERIPIAAGGSWEWDRAMQEKRQTQEVLAGIAAFFVFLVVTSVVVWLVRTVIEHRRWNRVSKTQFDVHNKLLERFSTTDELLAYIQTPVGRRFLESGPAPVPGDSRPVGAPFSRILWSVQVGIVLLAASAGLLFLSARTDADPSLFFMVFGVIALAIGVGFIGSGGAAWLVAARLGLIDRRDSHDA